MVTHMEPVARDPAPSPVPVPEPAPAPPAPFRPSAVPPVGGAPPLSAPGDPEPDDDDETDADEDCQSDACDSIDVEAQKRLWVRTIIPLLQLRSHDSDPSGRVQLAFDLCHIASCEAIARLLRNVGQPADGDGRA